MEKIRIAYPASKENGGNRIILQDKIIELGYAAELVSIEDEKGYNIIVLEPEITQWAWIDSLLKIRQHKPRTPVILFSPDLEVQEGLLQLPENPAVFLLNDINSLKKKFHLILSMLNMSKKNVLFVDDDTNILRAYERLMRKKPWRFLTAVRAKNALEILQNEWIDVVVTDIKMPGMHGLEMVARIRESKKDLPIIVVSGYKGMEQDPDLHFHNVAAFFEKPVVIADLEEKINAVLNHKTE